MTVVIKAYRFDLPPPAFTESNYSKGHWPIIHELEVDLKDYPDLHECIGVEMIISDRIYDGDNITFKAQYFNKDTGEHIFTSDQSVPDPSTKGYTYWNSYRIASWIGHCHWEVSEPMNVRIVVTIKKGLVPIGLEDFTMVVVDTTPTETYSLIVTTIPTNCRVQVDDYWDTNSGDDGIVGIPGLAAGFHDITVSRSGLTTRTVTVNITKDTDITINISEAPDFWTSPIEWIQYFVITTMDTLLGWMGGSFVSLLRDTKAFFDNSWTQIYDFFKDVPGAIVKAVQDNLHNILVWQTTQLVNFFDWISTLTSANFEALKDFLGDISDFVGTAFTGFVDWLSTLTGTVAEYISSQLEGFLIWGEGLLTDIWEGIQDWVMDLILGLIGSFNDGFDQGIEDQKNLRNEEEEQ